MSESTATDHTPDLRAKVAGSSFYAGMRVLPKAEREAMFAIYGFCRIVDDIADDLARPIETRRAELDAWREHIDALYRGEAPAPAAFLVQPIADFGIEREDFIAVIDGMQTDLDSEVRWPSFAEFDLYCDRVASAVGRLSVKVFGMERETGIALAHHLGRALQFTNVLRDIDEDAGIGRVYLPKEALDAAGIAPVTPEQVVADPRLDLAARWLAPKAQKHFKKAHAILAAKPQGHLIAPRLMDSAYSRVLDKMIAKGWHAPRRRIGTSKWRLLLALIRYSLLK
ncbi:MAG: presqualene diphosphate synthase HpnD [Novosphingobium sp.]